MTGRKRAGHTARKRSRTAAGPRAESLRDVRIKVTTIGDLLLTAADEHPDADALVFPGMRIAYGKLAKRAMAVTTGLIRHLATTATPKNWGPNKQRLPIE